MWSRRRFMQSAGASCCLGIGNAMPWPWLKWAAAAESHGTDRRLVVIELQGGNDGLNTVVPYADDAYHRLRPTLGIPAKEVVKLDEHLGLHPAMKSWRSLWDANQLAIVENCGYPSPNRSHFESRDIWHAGEVGGRTTSGWLGRASDEAGAGDLCYVGDGANPHALSRRHRAVASLSSLQDCRVRDEVLDASLLNSAARDELAADVEARMLHARSLSSQLPNLAPRELSALDSLASPLDDRLDVIRSLIEADQPFQVYYTALDGFDTHSAQAETHASLWRQTSEAVKSFLDKLRATRPAREIVVFLFSEFGRRVRENASRGTDHGAAAPVFLVGEGVRGGIHGGIPDLTNLDDGDLRHQVDFRDVYACLLRDWLKVPVQSVLGPRKPRLDLFQA